MIILDAVHINTGGGKILLDYLVQEIEREGLNAYYLFDARMKDCYDSIPVYRKSYLKGFSLQRALFYWEKRQLIEKVICFANTPPPIKLKRAKVYTYFQNVLLLGSPEKFVLLKKVRITLRSIIWSTKISNTNKWIVQTDLVANALAERTENKKDSILVIPFFFQFEMNFNGQKEKSFVFISSGGPHKNHTRLLSAWLKLAEVGLYPELHLTLPQTDSKLNILIGNLKETGIRIINHGFLSNNEIIKLLCQNEFVIYPSLTESFGLPLIEGVLAGCKIIGSDLPYLYSVIEPSATFNPYNIDSISDTVIHCLANKIPDSKLKITDQIHSMINLLKG